MESEEREYGITPNLGEFARYGLPNRYWGCDARYFADRKGKKRIEIPSKRETYWGFTDKTTDAEYQEKFMDWINGILFPLIRKHVFDADDFGVVDPEFISGRIFVGKARLNRTKTRLLLGAWERQSKQTQTLRMGRSRV